MKSNQEDLVSIIIPFYNEKNYFDECINSVLNQSYKNIEIIIINDGSDNEYIEYLRRIQSKNPDRIFLINKENEGVSSARNLGIQKANGKYVSFLDSDDIWLPNKIEYQLNIIKKKKINFIHNSYLVLGEDERIIGKFIPTDLRYENLIKSCDIGLSTVLLSAELAKKNLFPNISTKEDYVCWLKIVRKINNLHSDKEVTTIYRRRGKSLSSNFLIKFVNAYKVYHNFEKFGHIRSIIYTFRLSIYYLLKENLIRNKYIYPIDFRYLLNFKNLSFENSFILVALNMASLSYMNLLYQNYNNVIFWIDGVCAKFIIKDYVKTAGRKVIEKISLPSSIENVYLCGKKSNNQLLYIQDKLRKKVEFIELPYFNSLEDTSKFKLKLKNNSTVFINISTPKQEIIAKNILKYNSSKKIFVFCLGGGIAMAAGEEEIVPDAIERLNLEWLWRLKSDTFFRLKRLIRTGSVFAFKKIFKYFSKVNFKELV
ncbi:glycosyltransferase [Candidatus Pelagibacter sp. HIMB1506]|uniref:glycosyltransferase family 2 protein n=1 Tax=Candidatus Pelagibacter sp. HIMB1506 TaxID=3413337 RepID=UPI003F831E29